MKRLIAIMGILFLVAGASTILAVFEQVKERELSKYSIRKAEVLQEFCENGDYSALSSAKISKTEQQQINLLLEIVRVESLPLWERQYDGRYVNEGGSQTSSLNVWQYTVIIEKYHFSNGGVIVYYPFSGDKNDSLVRYLFFTHLYQNQSQNEFFFLTDANGGRLDSHEERHWISSSGLCSFCGLAKQATQNFKRLWTEQP